jgi:hypothetical protein
MPKNRPWSKEELILALELYFRIGLKDNRHPDVINLSQTLNQLSDATTEGDPGRFRNPAGVAMKLSNFARLDGAYRGKGMTHGNKLEPGVWNEFNGKKAELAAAVAHIESSLRYDPVLEAKATIGGQGFDSSSTTRKAVESAAMNHATEYYRSLGWQVGDVSANRPYDLSCTKPTFAELHVEVKGTTGDGSSVLLTHREVRHAREHSDVDLYILGGLTLEEDDSGDVRATGGQAKIHSPWDIAAGTLNPIAYKYSPPR